MEEIEMLTDNQRGEMIDRHRLYPPHSGVINVFIRDWCIKLQGVEDKYKREVYHQMLKKH
jgi:hypothetical protein